MNALQIAQHYFQLSNESNLDEITKMFSKNSTFCSSTFDIFVGVDEIMTMQRSYHGSFRTLKWTVNDVIKVKKSVIQFNFDFTGELKTGEIKKHSGIEYVVIYDGKLQHIQVRRVP